MFREKCMKQLTTVQIMIQADKNFGLTIWKHKFYTPVYDTCYQFVQVIPHYVSCDYLELVM